MKATPLTKIEAEIKWMTDPKVSPMTRQAWVQSTALNHLIWCVGEIKRLQKRLHPRTRKAESK